MIIRITLGVSVTLYLMFQLFTLKFYPQVPFAYTVFTLVYLSTIHYTVCFARDKDLKEPLILMWSSLILMVSYLGWLHFLIWGF